MENIDASELENNITKEEKHFTEKMKGESTSLSCKSNPFIHDINNIQRCKTLIYSNKKGVKQKKKGGGKEE